MSVPSDALAELLKASGDVPDGVSVYAGPANQIVPSAIVIRPDNPWMEPDNYCHDLQRYVAIAVVSAGSPIDGMGSLYAIALGIIDTINFEGSAWAWVSTGSPVIDETTGTAFLAAPIRLTYRNDNEEEAS